MDKISIIVPVYNAEKYLAQTVEALQQQSYPDIEIILVNDGSKDASWSICERLAQEEDRILCCNIPNGGPSNARNVGLAKATGKYVGFCDSDDLPNVKMYETLCSYMEDAKADIALCDIFTERDGKNFGFPWEDGKVFGKNEIAEDLMARMIGNLSDNDRESPVWGSSVRWLFKREIIEKNTVAFPTDIHFAEDLVFVLRYLSHAQRAVICDKALYFYTCNETSIMNSFYSYKKDMFQARRALVRYVEDIIDHVQAPELRNRLTVTERCYYHECVGNACRKGQDRTKKMMKEEIREIVSDPAVGKAFKKFDAKDLKTRIKYLLIKHRWAGLLYVYYTIRFK